MQQEIKIITLSLSYKLGSVEKLRDLVINTVYPGHGKPFPMEEFKKSDR